MELRLLQIDDRRDSRRSVFTRSSARALALFFGGFTLVNLMGGWLRSNFDANLWWIDLRVLPQFLAQAILFASALSLMGFAIKPACGTWRRWVTIGFAGILTATAFWNSLEFYALLIRGQVHSRWPIPLSLFVFAGLVLILRTLAKQPHLSSRSSELLWSLALVAGCAVVFPLGQMVCFGKTDYRRPSDAAVVFGARTYADGRPSDALADRVRTACQLYRDGLVGKLIFSGGPGDGAVNETEAMRRMALTLGVKVDDILVDPAGLNTEATVRNTEAMFAKLKARRILVVSHFYHLPRIKLAYQHAGREVYTVPARESYLLRQMPFFMAREVPAMWVYYLRPLLA